MQQCPYCNEMQNALKNHIRLSSGGGHGPSGQYPDDFDADTDGDSGGSPEPGERGVTDGPSGSNAPQGVDTGEDGEGTQNGSTATSDDTVTRATDQPDPDPFDSDERDQLIEVARDAGYRDAMYEVQQSAGGGGGSGDGGDVATAGTGTSANAGQQPGGCPDCDGELVDFRDLENGRVKFVQFKDGMEELFIAGDYMCGQCGEWWVD